MKKTLKRAMFAVGGPILLVALLFSVLPVAAQGPEATPEPELQAAPMLWEIPPDPGEIDGYGLGFIPPPTDFSHLTGELGMAQMDGGLVGFGGKVGTPAAYDWRNFGGNNYVTTVKNQGACGSCYAFASLANFEAREIVTGGYPPAVAPAIPGTPDYSEQNAMECNWEEMNNFLSGSPPSIPWGGCSGGNYWMTANLLSQKGTVLESCDQYTGNDAGACNTTCSYQKTLLDWCEINGAVMPNTSTLQNYIINYGPIYTSLYADGVYGFDGSYDGSYTFDWYPGTGNPSYGTNHAVMIVGWSNNLPPTLAQPGQPATGWIVKNSWGSGWGAGGYFYITYGSANIGWNSSFVKNWQDYDSNGGLMLHDEAGAWWRWLGYGDADDWGLATLSPPSDVDVTRIEFWTSDPAIIDAYIYDDFSTATTTPSNLLWSSTGNSFAEAGYHSIALGTPISQSAGDALTAVVRFNNSSYTYPVPIDGRDFPYESNLTYISNNGANGSWFELGDNGYGDVGIRLRYTQEEPEYDFGDAPEGTDVPMAVAYPSTMVLGNFPTCTTVGPAGSVMHADGTARFEYQPSPPYPQSGWDKETDGNAGLCPGCFPTYDDDECFLDGDAGLMFPEPFTIDPSIQVITCPNSNGTALGQVCTTAKWGNDVDIYVVNNTALDAYVNVLMDWDQDGQWSGSSQCSQPGDAPEHVVVDCPVPSGANGPLSNWARAQDDFTIGPNSGYVWSRFTITYQQLDDGWNGEGSFSVGETEDYLLLVAPPQDYDFGDAPEQLGYPTTLASNGARHLPVDGVFLDGSADYEIDGQPDPNALGDDNDTLDDENGVSFTSQLIPGGMASVDVNVCGNVFGGTLNAWVDFDIDGDWADANEQIFIDLPLATGTHNLNFMVPPGANSGTTFARFRISSQGGLSYTGVAPDGEVEDYEIDIESNVKWSQLPDISPTGIDIKVDDGLILADDWLCTETSWLTDVHFWASWLNDEDWEIGNIHLSVHEDIPAGVVAPYSMPGTEVWSYDTIDFDAAVVATVDEPGEFWWDPRMTDPSGFDQMVWQYDIIIPGSKAFLQTGSSGTKVYWLDIAVEKEGAPAYMLGWKTRDINDGHFNDDAVWSEDGGISWNELTYPYWHPYEGQSIDMAFELTFAPIEYDFGDAPDPTYPTLAINSGPSHLITPLFMGMLIDAEPDGQPTPLADGDDTTGAPDDEDGVTFGLMQVGQSASATVNSTGAGFVDAWIDFNIDGDWADPGEYLTGASIPVVAGANVIPFTVPAGATVGTTFARFRLSSVGGLSYIDVLGPAPDGEVEDYMVDILEPEEGFDFGDALDPPYETLWASGGARHIVVPILYLGAFVDQEPDGQPDPAAMGDDMDTIYPGGVPYPPGDEDGVFFVTPLMPGREAAVDVICGPIPGQLDAWVDFNGVNSWADPGEQIIINQPLVPASVNTFKFTVPAGATVGTTVARFRLSSAGGLSYTGAAADGEVEDHMVNISPTGPIYVDDTAGGYDTGTSWKDAYVNLQDGLGIATAGDEIWVASGTYAPVRTGSPGARTDTFQLVDVTGLYGGFAGIETARNQRNCDINVTMLSGEILNPGTPDNCYHVVTGSGVGSNTVIDGFTIKGSNGSQKGDAGGGMFNNNASPMVSSCIFIENESYYGGGMGNINNSSPTVINCTFSENEAKASHGGGMYNFGSSSPALTNCLFNANIASGNGGAIYNENSSPALTNCTVYGNSAGGTGGGIQNMVAGVATLTNSIFWGDSPSEIANGGGSSSTVAYCCVSGSPVYAGAGNINDDPLFVNESAGDFHLQGMSPCLDAGTNSAVPPGITEDFEGDNRFIDGDGDGTATVDMGVDEAETVVIEVILDGATTRVAPDDYEQVGEVIFHEPYATWTEGGKDFSGTPVYTFSNITAVYKSGSTTRFICTCVKSGTYDVTVTGNDTLTNVMDDVMVIAPSVVGDGGLLLEGDSNQDETVDGLDFAAMKASFLKSWPDLAYDPLTDYNDNGTVDGLDFSLLKGNFLRSGPRNS